LFIPIKKTTHREPEPTLIPSENAEAIDHTCSTPPT
jgi:hypothetical protein